MGIGWRELIIILLIALLVFGAKKLRNIGSDLGAAVRGFKKAVNDGDTDETMKQIKHEEGDADFESGSDTKSNADAKSPGNRNA